MHVEDPKEWEERGPDHIESLIAKMRAARSEEDYGYYLMRLNEKLEW